MVGLAATPPAVAILQMVTAGAAAWRGGSAGRKTDHVNQQDALSRLSRAMASGRV